MEIPDRESNSTTMFNYSWASHNFLNLQIILFLRILIISHFHALISV